MKKFYVQPEIEVIGFETQNVMLTIGGALSGFDEGDGEDWAF